MTERELQDAVLELLGVLGWRAIHHRPARTAHGWATPVQGPSSTGFPDVFALKGGRIVVAELKVGRNKVTPEQQQWLDAFTHSGAEVFVWRDTDWAAGHIEAALRQQKVR